MREIVVNDKVLRLVGDGLVNFKDFLNQSRKQAIALESPHPLKVQQAAGNVLRLPNVYCTEISLNYVNYLYIPKQHFTKNNSPNTSFQSVSIAAHWSLERSLNKTSNYQLWSKYFQNTSYTDTAQKGFPNPLLITASCEKIS